ncbi:hypothetical protein [Microbulbifer sp. ANSA005]|uniref:hypothetical protein n=1 Tax=Microbulbifer sp. ANSA005 TaxID=3243362 RepID=UPI004042FE34
MSSRYGSEEAFEKIKEMAPGYSDSEYRDAVTAAIQLTRLAKETFDKFVPGDYSTIDYDNYLKAADLLITNYDHHVKRGVLNIMIQNSLR